MSTPTIIQIEEAYQRSVLVAVELLDAVTLERVSDGVNVLAEGLQTRPIVNPSGLFVWLKEKNGVIRKIMVDPGLLPYEKTELDASEVSLPLTTIQLQPGFNYDFAPGITGLRGRLVEQLTDPQSVGDAEVKLRWLDDSGSWQDAPTASQTRKKSGDFVLFLRLGPKEKPDIDANGAVTVRLRVRRDGLNPRTSTDFKLLQGRMADPSALNSLMFAWDELQP
jgi:hypothetical protein